MTIRIDAAQKLEFSNLCKELGLSANAAINKLIRATLKKQSLPADAESEEDDDVRAKAIEAFKYLRARAEASTEPEMTLDEINAEISAARRERKNAAL